MDINVAIHRQMAVLDLCSANTVTLRIETNFEFLKEYTYDNSKDAPYNQNLRKMCLN